jgi:hypothetical protein
MINKNLIIVELREHQNGPVRETRRFTSRRHAEEFKAMIKSKTALFVEERPEAVKVQHVIEVWLYDVWGNEEDGYDVNDRTKIASYDTDLTKLTSKDIDEIIKDSFHHEENISIDNNVMGDNPVYLLLNDDEHTDYPLGEIYLREE